MILLEGMFCQFSKVSIMVPWFHLIYMVGAIILALTAISCRLRLMGLLIRLKGYFFQGNQHVEVYSRGLNVTPRTAGKEDWLRRFYNSAVECMAAISGYSKSQIADATSGMFNSIIRLA